MRGNLLHTLSISPFSQQQPSYKKEPYSYYTVRPKRVGYWKASDKYNTKLVPLCK